MNYNEIINLGLEHIKPNVRVTTKDKDLNGNLEVRNWLDKVEDKVNGVLGDKDVMDLMSKAIAYETIYQRPYPNYKQELETILINKKESVQ